VINDDRPAGRFPPLDAASTPRSDADAIVASTVSRRCSMKAWNERFVSRGARRRADLFFADLMGLGASEAFEESSARPTRSSPRAIARPKRAWPIPMAAAMTRASGPTAARTARRESPGEEILGPDDDRRLVADTTVVPFRFVCSLDLVFAHPTDPAQAFLLRGSGTLISDRHVLTAAHNLLNTLPAFAAAGRRNVARVFAAPGRNGRTLPFGESDAVTVRVTPEWTAAPNAEFDFGLLTLRDPLGAQTFGTIGGAQLGWWSHGRLGGGTHLRPLEVAFLNARRPVNLDGYPNDKCLDQPPGRAATAAELAACTGSVAGNPRLMDRGSTQWRSFGHVVDASPATEPRSITFDCDSADGHSGGPVWLRWERYRNLVAINTGGFPSPDPPHAIVANMGVRITADVLQTIRAWMALDGVRPTF
jgi:V8-like Glu-specific endopeptidase